MTHPRCTVLIATHDRSATLARNIDRLAAQSVGPEALQVVVVDDGSTDDTLEILTAVEHHFGELVVRTQPNQGPAVARNLGLESASAPITLFLNDDSLARPEAVEAHLDAHARHPGSMVLGAFPFVPELADDPLTRMLAETPLLFSYPLMTDGDELRAELAASCNLSVATPAARELRFDPRFPFAAEDVDFALRLEARGCVLRYCADAVAEHDHRITVEGLARTSLQRGFGAARLALKRGTEQQLLKNVRRAATDRAALQVMHAAAMDHLQDALTGLGSGEMPPQSAYLALAEIFQIGNLLGCLDEPVLASLARSAA
jgi:GT2 family glycosyltransferase